MADYASTDPNFGLDQGYVSTDPNFGLGQAPQSPANAPSTPDLASFGAQAAQYAPDVLTPENEAGLEQQFSQEHPYIYGVAQGITGMVPKSLDDLKRSSTLPMPSHDVEQEQAASEQLGAQWRGEYGPTQQAASITGTALQALPLLGLASAESPFRATPNDAALVEQFRQAQLGEKPPVQPEAAMPSTVEAVSQAKEQYGDSYTQALQAHLDSQNDIKQNRVGRDLTTGEKGVEIALFTKKFLKEAPPVEAAPPESPKSETAAVDLSKLPDQESAPQESLQPEQPSVTIPPEDAKYAGTSPEFQARNAKAGQSDAPPVQPASVGSSGVDRIGVPERPDTSGTSTKNAYTDAAREKYGLAPAVQEARKSLGQSLVEAQSAESAEPGAARRLVDDINAGRVKAIDDKGDGLLTIETIDAQVERASAEDAVNKASTPDELDAAKARLQAAKDRQQAAYDADKLAGTHTARGLNARQMVAKNDYSLTRMEGAARAAQNGKPLSGKQSAFIQDLQKRIDTLEKQATQYHAGKARPMAERKQFKSDAVTASRSGKSMGDFLSEKANAARERIRQMEKVGVDCI